MNKSIYPLTIAAAIAMNGCSNPMESATPSSSAQTHSASTRHLTHHKYKTPTPDKEAKFHSIMITVAKSTKLDPKYKKLSLDSPEEKVWFKKLMYRLWDRQITRAEFIAEGTSKYPHHKYEFTYIANAYQNY
jgi:uncharacterized protein YceK